MNKGDKLQIQFDGKPVDVTYVQPGVVQKTASIFYVQDSVTGVWGYCFPGRLERLLEKYNGDLSNYKNRASRKAERDAEKAEKAAKKASKADAEPVEA